MADSYGMGEMGHAPRESLFADYNTVVRDKLQKRRSVFSPGQRMRMNVLPMFLNLLVPWGVFVFCLGITSTYIRYSCPTLVTVLLWCVLVLWVVLVVTALWARLYEPDPTWFTHFCLAVGVAAILGKHLGDQSYETYARKYYEMRDLRVAKDVDAGIMAGDSLTDVGIVYFTHGHVLHPHFSWHFKSGSLYCVAPILSNVTMPLNQQFDFWAVGKDCCSMAASDFRCGSWGNSGRKGGLRELSSGEAQKYRLAVQQAESLYNIMAPKPILLKWSADPALELSSWNVTVFRNFLFYSAVVFVFCLFSVAMHACRFSWIGRSSSAYGMEIFDDPSWMQGGVRRPVDFGVSAYTA